MTDYRLDGLSPRSFEHMIQALSLRAIGSTVTPFGDGPDGGREATFEGPTDYGPSQQPWVGYGVIQAKFLQRTVNTAVDGRWAIQQLRSELGNYSKRRLTRRKPEYYIFATNVVLTPSDRGGSKDRIIEVLQTFSAKYGLKGFDVWDYDKLRSLLDNNEEVRRSYAAWITPGDVLADLSSWLSGGRPDYYGLLVNFLQKELLTDQYAKLEQAGHSADESIPLANVFVDLPTSDRSHSDPPSGLDQSARSNAYPGFVDLVIRASGLKLTSDSLETTRTEPLSSHHGLPGRYVLIGGPGQGKSTVGQFVCQLFRAALLADVDGQTLDIEVQRALKSLKENCSSGNLHFPASRRLPFRIVLSELAASMASGDVSSLLQYMTRQFVKRTNSSVSLSDFKQILVMYPCLLFLDGLDEVPASTNREQVLNAVRDFWIDVASAGMDAVVIATSRPQGYNDDFSPSIYHHRWLVPLPTRRALLYARRLTHVRFGSDQSRVDKVMARLERAADGQATARLMRTPLQITIMTLLVDRMGQPPQERWALFREYYNLIYQREIERDIPAAAVLRDYRTDIDSVHRHVGLLLQIESEKSGSTDARLTTSQFSFIVEHHLSEEGHTGTDLEGLKAAIIEAAANRLVFLVGLEMQQVGFEIRSLQEFMAAEGLMDANDETTQARLRLIAGNYNWRNVFLFAAGKCFAERRYLRDTVESICLDLNDDADDGAHRATLAGSELALDLLQDGPASRQPSKNRALTRVALRLLQLPRTNLHRKLATIYQPATADIFEEELANALQAELPSRREGAWECLAPLVEVVGGRFSEIAKNCVARGDLRDEAIFHAVALTTTGGSWLSDRLVSAVPGQPGDVLLNVWSYFEIGDSAEEETGPWPRKRWPDWFASAYQIIADLWNSPYSSLTAYVIGSEKEPASRVRIGTIGDQDKKRQARYESLGRMPDGHPSWLLLHAYMEFARSPNKRMLARALELASTVSADERLTLLERSVPWPLAECLFVDDEDEDLRAIASAAENGELGDTDDWLRAEHRWGHDGVVLEDLLALEAWRLPFTRDIVNRGFPFSCCLVDHNVPRATGSMRRLVKIIRSSESRRVREIAANLVHAQLFDSKRVVGREKQIIDPLDMAEVARTLLEGPQWHSGIDTLSQARGFGGGEVVEALSAAGRKLWSTGLWTSAFAARYADPLARFAGEAWRVRPGNEGLVFLFAHLAQFSRRFEAPTGLCGLEYRATDLRAACVVIRARLTAQFDDLIAELEAVAGTEPAVIGMVTRAVGARHLSIEAEGRALLRLYPLAQGVAPEQMAMIQAALRDLVRRRRSPLSDALVWTRLGFPAELAEVLRSEAETAP